MITPMQAAAPLVVLGLTVTAMLTALAIRRSFATTTIIAATGLFLAAAGIPWALAARASPSPSLFNLTPDALGFAGLILLAGLATLTFATLYLTRDLALPREEYPLLLVLATLGAVTMATSAGFITLFLGLETMTIAMIGMIAYPRDRPEAEEAALKYLVLSGMSSALVLFGIGLAALATGHLTYAPLLAAGPNPIVLTALALIGAGAGFKLSVVPFHLWVPDIYAGAPAPSAAYVAVIPKIAVIAVILHLLAMPGSAVSPLLASAVAVVAILSMLVGNLLALMQENLKRVLGYSSIAHLGYLLVALLAAGSIGRAGVIFYLVTYTITVIGAFGVIGVLSRAGSARDADRIDDLHGLFWHRPLLATVMTLILLSLAGIPPAIGFMAKLYIMAAGVSADLRVLTATLVLSSVIGLFYYLRIIMVMALKPADRTEPATGTLAIPLGGWLTMASLGALILGFGIAPQSLMSLLHAVFK
ncbi:NADH-quinone oxidoreductase subunit N [Acidiphilium sp. PA]|uniref:NADH-quinone oxidoreductase subunit N n=1 Tax=Acidiphilium sp. PA TaxID=2871705 RepID=UPI002242CF0E|nr:NADH-quinone oxidoreductase subunit N [Acidiphilium sp. PA]MCW8306630.1 NADH-quinone oxidoreductase subunit N [Acidiphilium sp. PA]